MQAMSRRDPISEARTHIVKDLEICLERWSEDGADARRFLKELSGLSRRLERWTTQVTELVQETERKAGRAE